jgi:multisubunit Na+/H+ antiporter MnhB subunit
MKQTQFKKSAVDLTDLAIGILILGIVASIGSTVLINLRNNRLTDVDTVNVVNETVAGSDGGANLDNTWFKAVTSVVNATGGETIEAANYSTSVDGFGTGTITLIGTSLYNGTNVNVNYQYYNESNPQWSLPNNASIGLGEYGNWFTILVLVGVASVILALIFMAFGGRGNSSPGISY